jgi:tRNA/tmRNA/rRNA uracil-C5-methylase (TrmA/RlmC/RlmD family)
VSMLAGVRGLGIEIQPSYVSSAQECAQNLHLNNVAFVAGDARVADLSRGSVFLFVFSFHRLDPD